MSQKERLQRLLPNGYPRYVRVYDNKGLTTDRYTVVFTGRYNNRVPPAERRYAYLSMSDNPMQPNGFCTLEFSPRLIDVDEKYQRFAPAYGKNNHLGTRIHWHEMPAQCIKTALYAYKELWGLHDAKAKKRSSGGITFVVKPKA